MLNISLHLLPPRRSYHFSTILFSYIIQRFYSAPVALFVGMVITLGHGHRLVTGQVVDLFDRYGQIQEAGNKGMAQVVGADVAQSGPFAG